jgi:hypothetical protein
MKQYLVHLLGKEMDSMTVTVSVPANSLEAFYIFVVQQGERKSTGGSDLTAYQSSRLRKDKCLCQDPFKRVGLIK